MKAWQIGLWRLVIVKCFAAHLYVCTLHLFSVRLLFLGSGGMMGVCVHKIFALTNSHL